MKNLFPDSHKLKIMSIMRVPQSEYGKYITSAATARSNRVYPLSIAEGYQSGDIFIDKSDPVNAVLFWHYIYET